MRPKGQRTLKHWAKDAVSTLEDCLQWLQEDLEMMTSPVDKEITRNFMHGLRKMIKEGKSYDH